jgi:pyridoxal 5'-phosphate synthase pdxS subunit
MLSPSPPKDNKLEISYLCRDAIATQKQTNMSKENRQELNRNLAQMLKGGVIMDVTTPEQARIAEEAGACAVMALERIPADIRAAGGVSRMSDPKMIRGIQEAVTIPVMAKCRI